MNELILSERLAGYLAVAKENDVETFLAFWLLVGTSLTQSEVSFVRWEHLRHSNEGWKFRGDFGRGGSRVEASIVLQALKHIEPMRQREGLIVGGALGGGSWTFRLGLLLRYSGAGDIYHLRARLNPPKAIRIPRAKPTRKAIAPHVPTLPVQVHVEQSQLSVAALPEAGGEIPFVSEPGATEPKMPIKPAQPKRRERLASADEVAASLGMSRRWVVDLVKAGELVGYRLGQKIQVSLDSVESLLEARRMAPQNS